MATDANMGQVFQGLPERKLFGIWMEELTTGFLGQMITEAKPASVSGSPSPVVLNLEKFHPHPHPHAPWDIWRCLETFVLVMT